MKLEGCRSLFASDEIKNSCLFAFGLTVMTAVIAGMVDLVLTLKLGDGVGFGDTFHNTCFVPGILKTLIMKCVFGCFFACVLPTFKRVLKDGALSSDVLSDAGVT